MMMTVKELENLLDLNGTDLSRWEASAALDARNFMAASAQARAIYSQAQSLDQALASYTVPALDPDVVTQAIHRAVHQQASGIALKPAPSRASLWAWPSLLTAGGMAGAFALIAILILPDFHSRLLTVFDPEIEAAVHSLSHDQDQTVADAQQADQIFGMLQVADSGQQQELSPEEQRDLDDVVKDPAPEPGIWETFSDKS